MPSFQSLPHNGHFARLTCAGTKLDPHLCKWCRTTIATMGKDWSPEAGGFNSLGWFTVLGCIGWNMAELTREDCWMFALTTDIGSRSTSVSVVWPCQTSLKPTSGSMTFAKQQTFHRFQVSNWGFGELVRTSCTFSLQARTSSGWNFPKRGCTCLRDPKRTNEFKFEYWIVLWTW